MLEFHLPIDGQQYVEFVLSGGQERAIFERASALFVNCGSFVTGEEQLNPRIYAFINEDAHSTN